MNREDEKQNQGKPNDEEVALIKGRRPAVPNQSRRREKTGLGRALLNPPHPLTGKETIGLSKGEQMTEARNRKNGNSLPREIRMIITDGEPSDTKEGNHGLRPHTMTRRNGEPPKNESTPKERPKGKS